MAEALRVSGLLRRALSEGVAPALAFAVLDSAGIIERWSQGRLHPDGPPLCEDTPFDLASLTKPLTTTLWYWRCVTRGLIAPGDLIGEIVPVSDPELASTPVWRLLTHTSGVAAHQPYFKGLGPSVLRSGRFDSACAAIRRMVRSARLQSHPGAAECYSDIGYLLLEQVLEAVDAPLGAIWPTLPFHGTESLHFRAPPVVGDATCAATEQCPWRGRLLQGEVHDENCWTMGGVAGHAGLFGSLSAVAEAARAHLRCARGEDAVPGVDPEAFRDGLKVRWMHPLGTRVLGWDTPTPGASSSGTRFSRRAFGHLGFTGTSIWIDPEADRAMVLLTNRVCPSRESQGIRWLRPALHDAGWEVSRET